MMLTSGPKKEAPWTEEKVRYFDPQSVMTAEDRNYQQFPPEIDLPYAIESLEDGMGQSHQQRESKQRYSHTLYGDCSSGHLMNGPKINAQQTLGSQPYHIVVFKIAGVDTAFMAAGVNLYQRTDDSGTGWTLKATMPAAIGQMAVYRGTQANDFLFIPVLGNNYRYMDSTGTINTHGSQGAYGFVVVGDELFLWNFQNNQYQIKKSMDGGSAPVWIGNYPVGDGSNAVNEARVVSGRLILGKTNGLYGVSALVTPLAEDITPSLKPSGGDSNNCRNSFVFDENYVFPYNGGLYRYDPNTALLAQFGLETITDNKSEVKGKCSVACGVDGIGIYALYYNSSNTTSYLVKWGTWKDNSEESTEKKPLSRWHGSLYQWASKSPTMIQVVTMDFGDGKGKIPRIYVGFSDNTVAWFIPSRTVNPLDDPNYSFNTVNAAELYLPRYTANFPFEYKVFKNIGLVGHNISGTQTLAASYKRASDVSYTSIGTVNTEPGEKIAPQGTPADRAFDIKITASTTVASSSPVTETIVIYCAIRFENLKRIIAWVNVSEDILNRSTNITRARWEDIKQKLEDTANSSGSVTVISPSGETLTCLCVSFSHAILVEDTEKKQYKWVSRIELIQTKVEATRGTWNRAAAYTWNDLSVFKWAELSVI